MFSNVRSVLSQCNTRLRLLHLLYDIEVMWRKAIKHAFSVLYSDKTFVFDQSERAQGPTMYLYYNGKYTTRKIYTKLHRELKWRIFHILTSKDIVDFFDLMLDP